MLDARPFLTLKAGASTFKAGRPIVRPLSLGVTNGPNGVTADQATHTIEVYVGLSRVSNAALNDGALVLIDDTARGQFTRYRILRNGVSREPGIWTLYVRAEDAMTAPEPVTEPTPAEPAPAPTPAPDDWYMP